MIRPEDIEADFWDALPIELKKELIQAARAPEVKRITTAKSSQQATLFKFGVSAEIDLTKGRSPVKEKDGTSPKRGTKQPKLTSRAGDGLGIQGLDFGASEANSFTDLDFKPIPASIDGISLTVEQSHGDETGKATERKSESSNNCLCGNPVKFQRVQKAGPNQGKLFKACAKPYNLSGRCNFFAWATSADEGFVHKESVTALSWARFESSSGFRMTPSNGRFKPEAILQGRVGDCWFLSAVAIVSLREDLCTKIVCNYPAIPGDGKLTFNLFIDGYPRQVVVDNYLPIKTAESVSLGKRGRKQSRGVDALEFSNCGENSCMWVPFLEKAYAKAHGSYHAISGGWIHEALFDLTGAPCLELDFSSFSFDSEATWTLLSSYHAARYPLGCSTSFSSKGIVGHHAYSVLEVEELPVEECAGLLGMQASIKAFATTTATTTTASGPAGGTVTSLLEEEAKLSVHLSAHGSLRLLRIRNPWGRQSFSGDFSHSSEFWTATMRRRLTQGTKEDGTFWMSYHDFLAHFTSVDVCLADASGGCVGRSLEDTTCSSPDYRTQGLAVELAPPAHCDGHVYVTVVQRTLRGAGHNSDIKARAGQNHATSPINHFACMVAVLRMGGDRRFSLELCRTVAPGRTSEPVQMLLRGGCRYRVQVLHLDLDSKPAPFVMRLYGPGNIVATASQVRLSSSSTGAGAADMDEGERSIVRSLAQCYLSSPHQAGRRNSSSPLYLTHGLFVERDSVLDAGVAGSGRRYHLTHLTSVGGGGRDVSLLLLLCSSPVSTASSDGHGQGAAASVRVILRTANRLVLSPFLVPGSARHAVATPGAAEDSTAIQSTSSLSPSPSPSSSTSRRTRERKKELFTERTLAVPLVPHTARIVAVVVRAVGGGDATGGNTRKTQQGHSNRAGRVLPVAVAHKLFEESPSSMQSLLAALPQALPLYEGVPLSAHFQAADLERVDEQGNEGASRAGDRVIINLE